MVVKVSGVAERFMRYVQIDTQSDPNSSSFPSTAKQLNLSKLLVEELISFGIEDAHLDANGYVMATIPATTTKASPVICFCSHVDTAPDCSGTDVRPILHESYSGDPIILPDDFGQIITIDQYPYLKKFIGKSIITASGKTLLGADDKAGVAIIMEMAKQLMTNHSKQHGIIKILFTPDEEVGRGTEHLDIQKLGAEFGYTLDGGELGCFEMETFSADALTLYIDGVMAHPGAAKGVMQNAIKIAPSNY
jgi:tripeptide aminopeptidase